jgi:hypothetical protein
VDLSPGFIGKLEDPDSGVGVPKRSTVVQIARKVGMRPDELLLASGYLPDAATPDSADTAAITALVGRLEPGQRRAVLAYARHVLATGVTLPESAPRAERPQPRSTSAIPASRREPK